MTDMLVDAFKDVVSKIECPTCKAVKGEMCRCEGVVPHVNRVREFWNTHRAEMEKNTP